MERPTSLTVLGIFNIIFGAMGLLCTPFGIWPYFVPHPRGQNPVVDVVLDSRFLMVWTIGVSLLTMLVSVVLLAAGIGLLKVQRWARTASIGYAIYALVMGAVGFVINIVCLFAPLLEKMNGMANPAQKAVVVGGIIGGVVGTFIGLVYPIVLLIFMLRPRTLVAIQEAESEAAASAGNPPLMP